MSAVPAARVAVPGARARPIVRILVYVLLPIVAFGLVRAFAAETFSIPSESMRPTLEVGDRVLVNKLAYLSGAPRTGDLVVLERPAGRLLAKRVVAVGGQRVEIRDGVLHVDGRARREAYVDYSLVDGFFFGPARVPAGAVFVMGDNRGDSEDSRDFGPVPRERIVGRVDLRIPSPSRLVGG